MRLARIGYSGDDDSRQVEYVLTVQNGDHEVLSAVLAPAQFAALVSGAKIDEGHYERGDASFREFVRRLPCIVCVARALTGELPC